MLRIRITNRDGLRAKLITIIFLRDVPLAVVLVIGNSAQMLVELGRFQHSTGLLSSISTISSLIFLVDTLFIFRKDRRTLHDMLAGTIVIMK
jgi:uncharacterized RDD family membrane protein YckC